MSFQEKIAHLNKNFIYNSPHKLIKSQDISELLSYIMEIVNLYGKQLRVLENEIEKLKLEIYNNVNDFSF